MLSHPVMEFRCMGASPASTTAVVVSFTPAAVVASSPSAPVFTAETVAVVSTPAASFPTAPSASASARSTLHCCQLWPDSLACDTTEWVLH